MFDSVRDDLRATLDEIRAAGLHKPERVIGTPQSATVNVTAGGADLVEGGAQVVAHGVEHLWGS